MLAIFMAVKTIVFGILGKFTALGPIAWIVKWFSGGAISGLLSLVTKLAEILLVVVRWFVETLVDGFRYIIKSVPAVITLLTMCWGAYVYGLHFHPPATMKAVNYGKAKAKAGKSRAIRRAAPTPPRRIYDCDAPWPLSEFC